MRQVSVAELIDWYEKGLATDVVVVKDRIYARSIVDQADKNPGYEIVWAQIPP